MSNLLVNLEGLGVNSISGSSSRSIFGLYFLTWIYGPLQLQSYWCLNWAHYDGGSPLDPDPALDLYLGCTFDLNLASTLALSPVSSISHLSLLLGVSAPDLDPAQYPYLGCTFWPEFRVHSSSSSCPIYVSTEFIEVVAGVNSGFRFSSRSIFGLYFWTLT